MFQNRGRLRRRFARSGAHQQKVGFMPTTVPIVIASWKSEIPNHCNQRLPYLTNLKININHQKSLGGRGRSSSGSCSRKA